MRTMPYRRAISLAVAGVLLSAAAVLADSVTADANPVTVGSQTTVDLGVVPGGAVIDLEVTFQLTCSGLKHVNADQTVTLMLTSMTIPPDAIASGTSATIDPPGSGWPVDTTACTGSETPIPATDKSYITIVAPTAPGAGYAYTMVWSKELDPFGGRSDTGTFPGMTAVTYTLTVVGNTPPSLNLPADTSIEGNTTGGALAAYTVSATDAEDSPAPTPTCLPAVGAVIPLGSTTINCTVTDSGLLTTTGSFTVTVVDTTAPSLSGVPAGLDLKTTNSAGAALSYSAPTATDVVDASPTVTCSPASGALAPIGPSTVTCTATDASNNSSSASFPVNVTLLTPPVLSLPADSTVEGNTTGGAHAAYTVSATDAQDSPAPTPVCSPAVGDLIPLGWTTVSCTVTDSDKQSDHGTFRINVVDTTRPSLSGMPANQSVNTSNPAGAALAYSPPTASDIVDAHPAVSCDPASGTFAPVGPTTVTCTATDASGNSRSASFTVNVAWRTAPVLSLPGNLVQEGDTTGGAHAAYTVSATDAQDSPTPTPNCSPAAGSLIPLGWTTVSCTVMDSDGQSDHGTFRINVVDTTRPALSGMPGDQSLTTSNPAGAALAYSSPTASDVVDAHPSVSCTPASGGLAPVGTTTVTCTATDASGNSRSASFTVSVTLTVSGDSWRVDWDEPVDSSAGHMTANGERSIPVKLRIYQNGTQLRTGTATLRITACEATLPTTEIALVAGSRWTAKIDTSTLPGTCYRVAVMVGSAEAGFFRLDLPGNAPAVTSKSPRPTTQAPATTRR